MGIIAETSVAPDVGVRPRVGFVGVGWIGRHRMEAIAGTGSVEVTAIADLDYNLAQDALAAAPGAACVETLDHLLDMGLEGVVIATPSALHAEQSVRAIEAGLAVFCQKPLGRNGAETRTVVDAARKADRLLGVDLSYRETAVMQEIRRQIADGQIGEIFAAELAFHNAYGPGKPWFYDRALSGGGCVIDLGIHLVDLVLWSLDFPDVESASSRLYRNGRRISGAGEEVEDYATIELDLDTGGTCRLACSWDLPAGHDAVIQATFYGTEGGLAMHNVNGSYFDFILDRYDGRSTRRLIDPPDDWGGRAAATWGRRLAKSPSFDASIEQVVTVADVIDRIYSAAG